jgi:hypothetical protein
MRWTRLYLALCVSAAAIIPHEASSQTPVRFSGAAALALPVGDLGDNADAGFQLALRGEGKLPSPNWSLRGDLTWDYFGGKPGVDNYSYLGLAGNLVYRANASRVYEFGGLGIYGSHAAFGGTLASDETNLGVQAGLGVDFNQSPHTPFIEFGLTGVFTSGNNSVWFPVRIGVRF